MSNSHRLASRRRTDTTKERRVRTTGPARAFAERLAVCCADTRKLRKDMDMGK